MWGLVSISGLEQYRGLTLINATVCPRLAPHDIHFLAGWGCIGDSVCKTHCQRLSK